MAKSKWLFIVWLILLTGLGLPDQGFSGAKKRYIIIGTGSMTGVYYIAGKTIAKIVNLHHGNHGLSIIVESTAGSVANINGIENQDYEFGIVQSDTQYMAYHGSQGSPWSGHPVAKLRSVFSIHGEVCTLVAAEAAGIKTLTDLQGKTVNIGEPGSGHRKNAIGQSI